MSTAFGCAASWVLRIENVKSLRKQKTPAKWPVQLRSLPFLIAVAKPGSFDLREPFWKTRKVDSHSPRFPEWIGLIDNNVAGNSGWARASCAAMLHGINLSRITADRI
jgi:hypothetical protein